MFVQWISDNDLTSDDIVFFKRCYGGGRITGAAFRFQLRQYGRKAEVKGVEVRPHVFRHTFALLFLRNGGDIRH